MNRNKLDDRKSLRRVFRGVLDTLYANEVSLWRFREWVLDNAEGRRIDELLDVVRNDFEFNREDARCVLEYVRLLVDSGYLYWDSDLRLHRVCEAM